MSERNSSDTVIGRRWIMLDRHLRLGEVGLALSTIGGLGGIGIAGYEAAVGKTGSLVFYEGVGGVVQNLATGALTYYFYKRNKRDFQPIDEELRL